MQSDTSAGTPLTTNDRPGHLQCPFCEAYEVERLFLASLHLDSCACGSCGAQWDEDRLSGEFVGRAAKESVVRPRKR